MTEDNLVKVFSELKNNCKHIANKFTIKYHNNKALKKFKHCPSAQLSVKDHCYFRGLSHYFSHGVGLLSKLAICQKSTAEVNMVNKSPFKSFKKSNKITNSKQFEI
jgi:hypothetical protein